MSESKQDASRPSLLGSAMTCLVIAACGASGNNNYYDLGASSGISSVRVFYPAGTTAQTALTLSGGFTNSKEDMYWLANYLTQQGFIVFALSASDNLSVSGYRAAHEAGVKLIKAQSELSTSPIYHRVGKVGLIGYSMGGGGVLNAANVLGNQVAVVIGLAPFGPDRSLGKVTAASLTLTGTVDLVAPAAAHAQPAYENLPSTIKKACGMVSGLEHLAWISNQSASASLIAAWIKYFANGDQAAKATITNPPAGITYSDKNI